MTDSNTPILDALKLIRDDMQEIKQKLNNLESRFDQHFSPPLTREDIDEIGRRVSEEQGSFRIILCIFHSYSHHIVISIY